MEDKKKNTTSKKTNTKKTGTKKKTTTIKEEKVVNTETTKKTPKKTTKKTTTKKTTPKKTPKKVEPRIEKPEVIEEKKEELLEKTYIFTKDEQNNLDEVVSKLNKDKIVVEQEVVNRKESNRNIILVLLIAIVAIVLFCTIYIINNGLDEDDSNLEEDTTTVIDGKSYKKMEMEDKTEENISDPTFADIEYSNITNTNINDFELKVAKAENMLVLISSQTCYFFVFFEPIINEVLVEKEDNIQRLNISKMTKEETKRLRSYYKFKSAPTILVIRKGEVVADQVGALSKEDFSSWYDENVAS